MICQNLLLFFLFTFTRLSVESVTTVPKDYSLARRILLAGTLASTFPPAGTFIGGPTIALAAYLVVQTARVKFVFDEEAIEVVEDASRRSFSGGKINRWKYDTVTGWGFIPSRSIPILMYLKETQTNPEGRLHLFPAIMNGKALHDILKEKIGRKWINWLLRPSRLR